MKKDIKYKILLVYDTGDSFHTNENVESVLELRWSNLEIAQANLERIREHYEFCKRYSGWPHKTNKQVEAIEELSKTKDWHTGKYADHSIVLYTDAGEKWNIHAFWTGYFERLNSAEILIDTETFGKITF